MVENNVICTNCGKPFHVKPSRMTRHNRHMGFFCCIDCLTEYRKTFMAGKGNHQYGLRGSLNASFKQGDIVIQNNSVNDVWVYSPNHPFREKGDRVKKHRLIVEENYERFWEGYFVVIDGKHYLKKDVIVHHIDCDHDNNEIWNLIPCTKAIHASIHDKLNIRFGKFKRNKENGRFECNNIK